MTAVLQFDQERDDHGRFGSGSGGTGAGLPRHDTHAATEGGGKFQDGTQKEAQVTWAHEKAKEQGRPTYMAPNPAHDPAKVSSGGPFKLSYKPPTKGEYHEVMPDGKMVYHPAAPKPAKGAPRGTVLHSRDTADADFSRALVAAKPSRRIAFARFIDAAVSGEAPTAARLWRAGWNATDRGDLNFTPESLRLVLADQAARGNPLAWYYEHEDTVPLAERGGTPMRGVCSAPSSVLVGRGPATAPELWAEEIAWTDEAKRQIAAGERRQLSPIAAFDEDTREIVAIRNVSLCAEGATHHGTLLASKEGTQNMDELKQQILDAIAGGDWEGAEALISQAEGMDGGDEYAKMARACMTAAKGTKPPEAAPPPPPPVVARKMAALSRADVPAGVNVDAFNRTMAGMQDATARADAAAKRSDRATVTAILSRAIETGLPVDLVDEREQLAACNPEATERFVASLRRKAKVGVLVASKPAVVEAAPPKPNADQKDPKKPGAVETFGLTEIEMGEAAKSGVSFEAFSKAKAGREAKGRHATQNVGGAPGKA